MSSCCHATVSVPRPFLTMWLVGQQYMIVVFSGLLVLRIAHSIKIVVFSGLLVLRIAHSIASTRFYTSHIVNRLDFRLKKDGSYITFKSETALTYIFYAKNS